MNSTPEVLVLPTPEEALVDPSNRAISAQMLVQGVPAIAPRYVILGGEHSDSCLGCLCFKFTLHDDETEVDCAVYMNTNLVANTTLANTSSSNPSYCLDVSEDQDYANGLITTIVEQKGDVSSVDGEINYECGSTPQTYKGLLYYWTRK